MTLPSTEDHFMLPIRGRISKSGHFGRGKVYDLRHLRDGRQDGPSHYAHSGRPILAAEVLDACRDDLKRRNTDRVNVWTRSLSYLWRGLDSLEALHPDRPLVQDLEALTPEVWIDFVALLNRDKDLERKAQIYADCADAVSKAYAAAGRFIDFSEGNPFEWTPRSSRRSVEVPYPRELEKKIVEAFREERRRTQRRYDEAHLLAAKGAPPQETLRLRESTRSFSRKTVFTPPNILRFVSDKLLISFPDFAEFGRVYGFQPRKIGLPPDACPTKTHVTPNPITDLKKDYGRGMGLVALYRWFVPLQFDIIPMLAELVHIDGFNLGPVLDIDRTEWFTGNPESGKVTISSRKSRSGGKFLYVESGTGPNSPYEIIRRAIEITEPLHRFVLRRLAELRSQGGSPESDREIERLRGLEKRVWLALTSRPIGVIAIDDNDRLWEIADTILRAHSLEENGTSVKWSTKRIRDGFAQEVHVTSGYSPRAVTNAMQHEDLATSAKYLDQPENNLREVDMMLKRVTSLLDDPDVRAANWPLRVSASSPSETPRGAPGLLVFGTGLSWLKSAAASEPALLPLLRDVTAAGGSVA